MKKVRKLKAKIQKGNVRERILLKRKIKAPKETTEALKRVAELEKILQCKTRR